MKFRSLYVLAIALAIFAAACGGKSDADLSKAASDKLTADKVTGVTVVVKDGVATLSGEVADSAVKSKAEASVKSVEGIKTVSSNITVKALPTPEPVAADPMLQGKVDNALKTAGCTGAVAKISNGTVSLTGTVPAAKYAQCIQVVNEAGVGKVDNQLQKGK